MNNRKSSRQIAFFGEAGQRILNSLHIVVLGVGGVGSHVVQQLAFLNIGSITLIDSDVLEETNFNRLIGLEARDQIGTPKVEIVNRLVENTNPDIKVKTIQHPLINKASFEAIKTADVVFSCVDNDGARLVVNELCLAYEIPFIDVASDIIMDKNEYGGHVIPVINGNSCLYCLGEIDGDEARKYLQNPDARKDEAAIYGIEKIHLKGGGPSVISINGVVASLAVTEFLLQWTRIRDANLYLKYLGSKGIVTRGINHDSSNCPYCVGIRGLREKARVEYYLETVNS